MGYKTNIDIDIDHSMVVTGGERRGGWMKRAQGVKYTMMEGDETLGSGYKMQYTDDVL